MPKADPRLRTTSRARSERRAGGAWRVQDGWLEHHGVHTTRRVPLGIVLAALDHLSRDGAVRAEGELALDRVRGVRAHHPQHGRYAIELRSTRWELGWYPRGAAAQRLCLRGAVLHAGPRRWARDLAA